MWQWSEQADEVIEWEHTDRMEGEEKLLNWQPEKTNIENFSSFYIDAYALWVNDERQWPWKRKILLQIRVRIELVNIGMIEETLSLSVPFSLSFFFILFVCVYDVVAVRIYSVQVAKEKGIKKEQHTTSKHTGYIIDEKERIFFFFFSRYDSDISFPKMLCYRHVYGCKSVVL